MNYIKIHNNIIERAKNRIILGYTENHHILPKCLGGTNSPDNLVKLTAKEHFIIHRLLIRIYPENHKLSYAFWFMCTKSRNTNERIIPSSKTYEYAKLKMSEAIKNRLINNNQWNGKKHSEESKIKQSNSAKNRKTNPETEKLRREKISNSMKGKKKTEEAIRNISLAKMGDKNPMFGKKKTIIL